MLRRSPGSDKSLHKAKALEELEQEQQVQLASPYRKRRSTHHQDLEDNATGLSISQSASSDHESLHDGSSSLHQRQEDDQDDHDNKKAQNTTMLKAMFQYMNSTRLMVLLVLCLQNSLFTILRRYSQGVLREVYSKVNFCL